MNSVTSAATAIEESETAPCSDATASKKLDDSLIPTTFSDSEDDDFVDEEVLRQKKKQRKRNRSAPSAREKPEKLERCGICQTPWFSSGEHRICSLKCGHLFGRKCISRWLRQSSRCPDCSAKAALRDIRVLFTSRISVPDMSARDAALQQLDEAIRLRKITEEKLQRMTTKYENLYKRHCSLRAALHHPVCEEASQRLPISFNPIEAVNTKSARCVSLPSFGGSLVISEACDAGFGLSRISLQDTSHRSHKKLHSKPIRDVVPASKDCLHFLTGSLDKHLKLTDLASNSEMLSVNVGVPVWSCAWSPVCSSLLFCGLSSGGISVYDTRHARHSLARFQSPDSNHQLHSLQVLPGVDCIQLLCASVASVALITLDDSLSGGDSGGLELRSWSDTGLVSEQCSNVVFDAKHRQLLVCHRGQTAFNSVWKLHCSQPCQPTGPGYEPSFTPTAELRGHRAHQLLSRSAMFCTDEYCEVISADEERNAPVQWHLDTQQASSSVLEHCFPVSLKPHRTPVLALDADASRGLLASLSSEQLFIYKSIAA